MKKCLLLLNISFFCIFLNAEEPKKKSNENYLKRQFKSIKNAVNRMKQKEPNQEEIERNQRLQAFSQQRRLDAYREYQNRETLDNNEDKPNTAQIELKKRRAEEDRLREIALARAIKLEKINSNLKEKSEKNTKDLVSKTYANELAKLRYEKKKINDSIKKKNLEIRKYKTDFEEITQNPSEENFIKMEEIQNKVLKLQAEIDALKKEPENIDKNIEVLNKEEENRIEEISKRTMAPYRLAKPTRTKKQIETMNEKAEKYWQRITPPKDKEPYSENPYDLIEESE